MNCRKFESLLEWFMAEKLSPASMQECRAHLECCSTCRELLDLATREPIQIEPAGAEKLVQAVLEKTSGKGCGQARELLPDYVDSILTAASGKLIEQHLESCHSCRQIHQTLKELKEELPGLAQIDPGSTFTWECVHSIGRLQNQPLLSKISSSRIWNRLLVRPRLAWESAYVLTLLLFVFLKLGAFFPGLSQVEAISTLQAKSARIGVSIAGTIKENINDLGLSLTDRQDRWAKSSSERKEELFSTMTFVTYKTKTYTRSTSNAITQFPHSIWNGIVDQVDKVFPKDRTTI